MADNRRHKQAPEWMPPGTRNREGDRELDGGSPWWNDRKKSGRMADRWRRWTTGNRKASMSAIKRTTALLACGSNKKQRLRHYMRGHRDALKCGHKTAQSQTRDLRVLDWEDTMVWHDKLRPQQTSRSAGHLKLHATGTLFYFMTLFQ